jgi:hypothetical protein
MKGLLTLSWFAIGAAARVVGVTSPQDWIVPYKREALQNIVSSYFRKMGYLDLKINWLL